jgi:5'-phosphate synthase pdxT subunit
MSWLPGESLGRRRSSAAVEDGDPDAPLVGVLALQGDVLEHVRALRAVGLRSSAVRTGEQLAEVVALVLPGGESTAISRLLGHGGLSEPLARRIADGMPVLGTCAGLILLSDELEGDEDLPRPGGLAIRTQRNAYGGQRVSFDALFPVRGIDGGAVDAAFIRAPRVVAVLDPTVEVLAEVDGDPVVVQQGSLLAMTFHPEVTGDLRLHAHFAVMVRERAAR